MDKKYYPYWEWEEYKEGMWRTTSNEERKKLLKKAIKFTGNYKLYGKYMLQVIKLWEKSCEQNLLNTGTNRRAWVGHSAVCIAINCPEDITREAWRHLTEEQQEKANNQADIAIKKWEDNYEKKNKTIYRQMDFTRLWNRNTK